MTDAPEPTPDPAEDEDAETETPRDTRPPVEGERAVAPPVGEQR